MVERRMVTSKGPRICLDDLPEHLKEQNQSYHSSVVVKEIASMKIIVREAERQLIEKAIERYGSAYQAAKVLGVNQSTISRKLAVSKHTAMQ